MSGMRNVLFVIAVLSWAMAGANVVAADAFRDVSIEEPFDSALTKSRLLMESGGARIILNPDGSRLIIGVGRTSYDKRGSAQQRLSKERVARLNAFRELTAQTSPIHIVHRERLEEKSRVETISGAESRVQAIEDYLSVTTSQFDAVAKDLPVVGKWYSAEGDVLYVAIGKEFPADAAAPGRSPASRQD